jgi:amino acid transporter
VLPSRGDERHDYGNAAVPRLAHVIGVGALTGAAINSIVGSGIFGLPGIAAAMLGPAAVLGYVLCAVLIGLVGLCFAEAGSRVNDAGGLYAYASVAFRPIVGGIVGTLMWTALGIVPNAAVANLLMDTLARPVPALAGGPPRVGAFVPLFGMLAVVNIRGTRAGAGLSSAIAIAKVAPLILLAVCGAFAVTAANLHWDTLPSASQIGQAAVILIFVFGASKAH